MLVYEGAAIFMPLCVSLDRHFDSIRALRILQMLFLTFKRNNLQEVCIIINIEQWRQGLRLKLSRSRHCGNLHHCLMKEFCIAIYHDAIQLFEEEIIEEDNLPKLKLSTVSNFPMEKQHKSQNKLFKYLPRAASAVSFQNPVFSPGRDKRSSAKHGLGFSGPIFTSTLIPDAARRKPKNGGSSFDVAQEPTSPKVSCIGQIKLKHKKKKIMTMTKKKSVPSDSSPDHRPPRHKAKQGFKIQKIFSKSKLDGKPDDWSAVSEAPSLGMMKKFASGRESLGDFDWKAQFKHEDYDRDYHSDEEGGRGGEHGDEEGEKEVIIPHSAPILVGGRAVNLEARKRKEVNIWKRRSFVSPRPLQL
ncbi:hypothetical protein Nepgr_022364 [Nepenthes gracilis]|uniref:Uncharacterized protein n=1 Tax=Nepenthes gracilis TaxID=150966 RepID=A0AAD3SYK8_NEPGR|nr:hypothetical protein Nepgr_022364 [Nepenthes gracilis]